MAFEVKAKVSLELHNAVSPFTDKVNAGATVITDVSINSQPFASVAVKM